MNPWLESRWSDVHGSLLVYIAEELGITLPDDLIARADEHVSYPEGELITVIEILRPANKNVNRGDYRKKRDAYLEENINLVEIDLLREGKPVYEFPIESPPNGKPVDYSIATRRRGVPGRREFYAIYLRDALPILSIPLREQDDDVTIDLQKLVNRVFESGRYWKTNYATDLYPPLRLDDAKWAAELITAATEGE